MIFLCVAMMASPVLAKCYTSKEVEAEQGVRILSELMVIGLNCQHLTPQGQENLYTQYKKFALKNEALFTGYENTLLDFYRSEGISNPEANLHQMRTDVANKISKDAAVMRPDAFCAAYAQRIPKANQMSQTKIRQWASTVFPGHPASHTSCTR
jgi:hypothetical protein